MNTIHPVKNTSRSVRTLIAALLILIAALGIFGLGMAAGYQRAGFSERLGDNFHATFVGPGLRSRSPGMMVRSLDRSLPPGGHGVVGEIVSAVPPTFVIAGSDNVEKTIIVNNGTVIRRFRDAAAPSDLDVGEYVVVLGSPDGSGHITAKLIRLLPALSSTTSPQLP